MVGREVEREEVVPLGLDLGPRGHGETQLAEDADDFVHDLGHGVLGADPAPAAGHGQIHARSVPLSLFGLECLRALGEGRLEPSLELVHGRAVPLALLNRQGRERPERRREQATLPAEDGRVLGLERIGAERRDRRETREERVEIGVVGRFAHDRVGLMHVIPSAARDRVGGASEHRASLA